MSAASRTFDIPELLEGILLELPLQDLLRIQRVNKTFRDAIKTSHQLQVKLFFKSSPPKDGTSVLNPFLDRILELAVIKPTSFSLKTDDSSVSADDPSASDWIRMKESEATKDNSQSNELRYVPNNRCVVISGLYHAGSDRLMNGSWQEILAADPPCMFCMYETDPLGILRYPKELVTPQNMNELVQAIRTRKDHECITQNSV